MTAPSRRRDDHHRDTSWLGGALVTEMACGRITQEDELSLHIMLHAIVDHSPGGSRRIGTHPV